jgi:hypothetical protein
MVWGQVGGLEGLILRCRVVLGVLGRSRVAQGLVGQELVLGTLVEEG